MSSKSKKGDFINKHVSILTPLVQNYMLSYSFWQYLAFSLKWSHESEPKSDIIVFAYARI